MRSYGYVGKALVRHQNFSFSWQVHEVSSIKDNHSRVKTLEYWQKKGGVMIIGYDMFRRLTNEKARGVSKKIKERLRKALLDPGRPTPSRTIESCERPCLP